MAKIEKENESVRRWIVGPKTGKLLYWLVRVLEPEVAVEIGTSVGYSALWIAMALKHNEKGKLWTIESHKERFDLAKQNFKEAGLADWIVQVKGHAPGIFMKDPSFPDEIEFAFFDATKKEHQAYFDAIFPRMQKGGMIVVDNVVSHRGEMESFVERTHENKGLKVTEVAVGSGLLIARVL